MTTFAVVSSIFVSLLSLLIFGLSIFLLFKLGQEKGIGHAIIGFFFFPYPYIWGWINVKRLQIMDVMLSLTLMMVVGFIAPFALMFLTATAGLQSLAEQNPQPISFNSTNEDGTLISSNDGEGNINVSFSSRAPIAMGSIGKGQQVNGHMEDGMDDHDWTFQGTAGQQITIRCEATGELKPDIILLDPQDNWIANSEEDVGEQIIHINSFTLPEDGTYTIRIDTWGFDGGDYTMTLN